MNPLPAKLVVCIGEILQGKRDCIELAVTCLLARGHLLIEDQPGVGKTLLARSLANALSLPFQRVQCTADLLPADIVGGQVYNPRSGEITFRQGPVFTSILLADELNRTPPRTQSALLECMAEGSVTVDRTTHSLPEPFFVVATQNPMSSAGTYTLPDNQLDRFLLRVRIGYPDPELEARIIALEDGHRIASEVAAIASAEDLLACQLQVDGIHCDTELREFIVELAGMTRNHPDLRLGVSTRGAQALHRACRARALLLGRDYVIPEDLRVLLLPAWAHRVQTRAGTDADAVLLEMLANTAVPVERDHGIRSLPDRADATRTDPLRDRRRQRARVLAKRGRQPASRRSAHPCPVDRGLRLHVTRTRGHRGEGAFPPGRDGHPVP
jgi:MoxR-like ATPase